jgi:uncharacterized protein (DUF697 family)
MRKIGKGFLQGRPIAPSTAREIVAQLYELVQGNQIVPGIRIMPFEGGVELDVATSVTIDDFDSAMKKVDEIALKNKLLIVELPDDTPQHYVMAFVNYA